MLSFFFPLSAFWNMDVMSAPWADILYVKWKCELWTEYGKEEGFPGDSDGKESACNAGEPSSIPRLGRSPGKGNGKPLQYSCLEDPMDGGDWGATVHGVTKSQTWLSDFTFMAKKIDKTLDSWWHFKAAIPALYCFCLVFLNRTEK